jgi:hypothetical protein
MSGVAVDTAAPSAATASAATRVRRVSGAIGTFRWPAARPAVARAVAFRATSRSYKAAVETMSLNVPVGPDRRTPLRDVALLDNLQATLRAVLEQPVAAAS